MLLQAHFPKRGHIILDHAGMIGPISIVAVFLGFFFYMSISFLINKFLSTSDSGLVTSSFGVLSEIDNDTSHNSQSLFPDLGDREVI